MARIRTVKPEFWTDEDIASLSEPAMLLAIGLLNYSDDEGWFNANHLLIKAAVFPLREPSKTIPGMLKELSSIGYIAIYPGLEGKQYGRVLNFSKHQRVDKPKASEIKGLAIIQDPSKIPPGAIPSGKEGEGNGKEQELCTEPPAPAPFVTITLNDKTEFPIFESQIAEWETLFPRVDVRQELREMRAWALANHAKRKTSRGVLKFVTSWLAKEQDRGGNHEKNRRTSEHLTPVQKVQRAFAERRAGGEALDGGGADLRGQVDS